MAGALGSGAVATVDDGAGALDAGVAPDDAGGAWTLGFSAGGGAEATGGACAIGGASTTGAWLGALLVWIVQANDEMANTAPSGE